MKNHPLQQGKNISIFFNSDIISVQNMFLEHYDDKEPQGTLIFNWPLPKYDRIKKAPFEPKPQQVNNSVLYDLKDLKKRYNKLILLETEHSPFWVMPYLNEEWLQDIDEIWVIWLECFEFFKTNCQSCWDKLRWVPMRYTSQIKHIGNSENYEHNLGFFGQAYKGRAQYIKVLENMDRTFYHINGLRPDEVKSIVYDTKFILDVQFHPETEFLSSQNIIRIFENICMGKHVLANPSTFNYFDGMITIMNDPIADIKDLEWKAPMDFSEKYKRLTYTDEDFEQYKQSCIARYTKQYGDPFDRLNVIRDIWKVKNPLFGKI